MGMRCDFNLSSFGGGSSVGWNSLLGSGFAEPPKGWVSVYRECSLEELVRIAREGLVVPPPELRPPDMRAEMETLDRFRPAGLKRKGISRLGALYAAPTPDDTPRLPFRRERMLIELKVDPRQCFVGDSDFITALIPFIGAHKYGLERYGGAFRKYWESVISYADFRRRYRRLRTEDGNHWVATSRVPARLPRTYFQPEILVMSPMVSQRHIRIIQHELATEATADGE